MQCADPRGPDAVNIIDEDNLIRWHSCAKAVKSAESLLESIGIPGNVDVQDDIGRLEVLSLLTDRTKNQNGTALCHTEDCRGSQIPGRDAEHGPTCGPFGD